MQVGVPKEIKVHEYRVGLVPATVRELTARGHQVLVEQGAGQGVGYDDGAYAAAGATIVPDAASAWRADLVVKVKEPQPAEFPYLRPELTLFTYLHLAPDPRQAQALVDSGCTALAYETVTDAVGGLPLLAPMSAVAGRMAVQVGAHWLEKAQGGRGVLLGGVPGVPAAHVVVLGAGVVGSHATRVAVGLGAEVTVLDLSLSKLEALDREYPGRVRTVAATRETIEAYAVRADLLVGAVLVPGAAAPRLVDRDLVGKMKAGSVIVDVAIDQGGCVETSRPTTHADPTYVVDGVIHYGVANMPGAVPRTSAQALNNATRPFVLALADKGWRQATADDPHLAAGLNVNAGRIVHGAVAAALQGNPG
ncbi:MULTISPECIES: alanine dehydrogenase [Azospira]|jgi:alanine dehydrogenase|uniref:Alanine dehydrogenase n=2 Tax=Azospira oryzae TaxID=146939 RepID=G8QJ78_AZOOP|nr:MULTISPECIES: alanine dehydrogenase [Azospira]AEV26496.1 alanine dehydrogenase [Azospira oryzae PS]MBP7488521.1 alanine dehydrogenase [Azospira sp.]MDK9690221.1 alanine dehydrogenase [Azospira sp.]RZT89534.1 L-alanine dehydrogenase [Azospira oryzae]